MTNVKSGLTRILLMLAVALGAGLAVLLAGEAAATDTKLMLVVTPYAPGQKLDFFFQHSTHPLRYLEDDGQTPLFISMVTAAQRDEYVKAGYKPDIFDGSAGRIDQYAVLFKRNRTDATPLNITQSNDLKQQGVELSYKLNDRRLLVKFAPGASLGQVAQKNPQFADLKGRTFHGDLTPPEGRVSDALLPANDHHRPAWNPVSNWFHEATAWIVGLIIFLSVLALGRLWQIRKR